MNTKTKIGIVGLGGVGGYFGGMLAKKYADSKDIEIVFLTKPDTQKTIQTKGLTLEIMTTQKIVINTCTVISDYDIINPLDYLLCCVKSYNLEEALKSLAHCISKETIIIPLLNGVNSRNQIKNIYPQAKIIDGCVYIVSKISQPGVITVMSEVKSLYFGSNDVEREVLENFKKILLDAEIDAHYSEDIEVTLWEKFIFVSSLATATSYLNKTIGQILESEKDKQLLINLIHEINSLIKINTITVSENIIENTLTKINSLPYLATTSMHNDFKNKKKTEYQTLTEFIVTSAKAKQIATPTFNDIHADYDNWVKIYL